jgi:hypothetical protein
MEREKCGIGARFFTGHKAMRLGKPVHERQSGEIFPRKAAQRLTNSANNLCLAIV